MEQPDRLVDLSLKMAAAAQEHREWLKQYILDHAELGKPLPYHPNLGLAEDEYEEFQRESEKLSLTVFGSFPLEIRHDGQIIRLLTTSVRSRFLNEFQVDAETGSAVTPVGMIPGPATRKTDAKIRTFGEWPGVEWKYSSPLTKAMTGKSMALIVGETPRTGHVVIECRFSDIENGNPVRQEEILFRFMRSESR